MARTDGRSGVGRRLTMAFVLAVGAVGVLSIAAVPMRAITRADATRVRGAKQNDPYASFVEPTRFKNGEDWSGVGKATYDQGGFSPVAQGTGTLISPCHVLTAGHVFFPSNDARGGIGNKPDPRFATFTLVPGAPGDTSERTYEGDKIFLGLWTDPNTPPTDATGKRIGYKYDKDKAVKDSGHRIVDATDKLTRDDIAILKLTKSVPRKLSIGKDAYDIEICDGLGQSNNFTDACSINRGEIDRENNPGYTIPNVPNANAVKVGFGTAGDGAEGATWNYGGKREMFNVIDTLGTALDDWVSDTVTGRNPPGNDAKIRKHPAPVNTLVYDFDNPNDVDKDGFQVNASRVPNTFDLSLKFKPNPLEGSAAPGDSGGPMFQYKYNKKFLVGITSSGSDTLARYGTVGYDTQVQMYKDWIDSVIWKKDQAGNIILGEPDCPAVEPTEDWGDAPQSRGYPSSNDANGARHLDYRFEWLGRDRDPDPSASFEVGADDPMDEDGVPNLVNQDRFDDGVILPSSIMPGQSFQITVRVSAKVDVFGFGPLGRYDKNDPLKRLYLNAWADWQDNGSWHDAGDKIIGTGSPMGTVAIDPETFGPDGRYTPGESFQDVGEDGVAGTDDFGEGDEFHEDGEPFTDTAGNRYADLTFTIRAPDVVPPAVYFRFRLDYGEDVGNLHNPMSDPSLSEDQGPAAFGEVEDYVVDGVPPVCWLASLDWGPPVTAIVMMQDAQSGLAHIETLAVDNLTVHIPAFEMGERAPIAVDLALIDQSADGEVTWRMSDVAGNQTVCDPAKGAVVRYRGKPETTTFTGIAQSERHVRIKNGAPGINHLRLEVNQRKFEITDLADNQAIVLDISAALLPGTNNIVSVTPLGKPGGTAALIISE